MQYGGRRGIEFFNTIDPYQPWHYCHQMTQQNRVDPWSALQADSCGRSFMGKRGILHDDEGNIMRKWATSTWVTCVLDFRSCSCS